MLLKIDEVKFSRCLKPPLVDPNIEPDLVTFNDGNPEAFGTVAYALWTLLSGERIATLIMSKAKLGSLTHKGETVKN